MQTLKVIYVTEPTRDKIRMLAYKHHVSMGAVVDGAIDLCILRDDPRTPTERAQDTFTAEVLDTQESDRP
jgi:hypothetical protein